MADPVSVGGTRMQEAEWSVISQYMWLRKIRGHSQRALDDLIGSSCYIEKLEAGMRNPSLKTLTEWAQALGGMLVLVPLPGKQVRLPPTRSGAALTMADRHTAPST